MAKTQKPNEEKIVKENVQKRFKNMFTGESEPPTNMSLKEVEALQARIAELESKLAKQYTLPSDGVASTAKSTAQYSLGTSVAPIPVNQQEAIIPAILERRISLWVTGIMAVVGLIFFGVALYIVFMLQGGSMELSDKVLMPFSVLMFAAGLIGWLLVRRERPLLGLWIPYLINVILGPILVVLVLQNFSLIMGGYLAVFSLLFIALILPKTSRLPATLFAVGTALAIGGIEVWNPAFRLSTSHIQNFTLMILGPAAAGILALSFVTRQLWISRISSGRLLGRRSLVITLAIAFFTLSVAVLLINSGLAIYNNYVSYRDALAVRQTLIAQDAGKAVTNFVQEKFSVLETAVDLRDPTATSTETRESILGSILGLQPAFRQMALLSSTNQRLASISRLSSSLSTQFESRITEDVLARTKAGQRYIGPVYIDDATSEPQVVIAVPIKNSLGDFQGTLVAELNLKFMWDLVDQLKVGETGYVYVVDDRGNLLAAGDTARVLRGQDVKQIPEVKEYLKDPWYQTEDITPGLDSYTGLLGKRVVGTYVPFLTPAWGVFIELPTAEAYQSLIQSLITTGVIILLFAILVGLIGSFLARRLSTPLIELSDVATEVSNGNLSVQAKASGPSEIAQLATTFNMMTGQLREMIAGLEQRVADRTHDLELAAEVGRTITEKVSQISEMSTEAVETIRARFDLYYTQLYLIDPSGDRLVLRAGTGNVGKELLQREHSLAINTGSLNGRAVIEKQAQIVADTGKNPTFLPNPLLPNTRSEMSVPLMVGGRVVGVLDMQSEQPEALSESNLPAFEALAGQLAVAIHNANLFAEVQEARSEVEAQVSRFTKQGWEDFLNAIQHGHKIGFAFERNQVNDLKLEELSAPPKASSLNLPVMVTGTKVGEIQIPMNLKTNELEMVSAISEQLGQHVENLRLLAEADKFQKEAEQALHRMMHEGWETYLNTGQSETGYVYDLNQVQPLSKTDHPSITRPFKQPLVVRNETIGELKLDLPEASSEASDIVAAVAQQLSVHLETLRLSEINESHAQREKTLREITNALRNSTNPTTILRTAVRELGKTLGRRTIVQLANSEPVEQAKSARGNGGETNSPVDPA